MSEPTDNRRPKFQFSLGMLLFFMFMASITVGSVVLAYTFKLEGDEKFKQLIEKQQEQMRIQLELYSAQFQVSSLKQENEALKKTNQALLDTAERAGIELQAARQSKTLQ